MTITVETMREKLLSLDKVRETLGEHEPLDAIGFTIGNQIRFDVANAWEFGVAAKDMSDVVDVWVTLGGGRGKTELRLTKEALFQFTSYTGMPQRYIQKLPAGLLGPSLNYWFREGLADRSSNGTNVRDFKILKVRDTGVAVTRQTVDAFSTLTILDEIQGAIQEKYGDVEVMVDPRFFHTLRQTSLRLVIPGVTREITGTSYPSDEWSVGFLVKNSLNGRDKTTIDGYLFRWLCTNGAIDVRNPAGGSWVRKVYVSNDGIYDWARATAQGVLANLDASLDAVQASVEVDLEGNVAETLRDVFNLYKVRAQDRPKIIELLAHAPRLTMYEVMQAITQVASDPSVDEHLAERLQRLGGEIPHASTSLCASCRRLSHVH